jgi:hypothetical protein
MLSGIAENATEVYMKKVKCLICSKVLPDETVVGWVAQIPMRGFDSQAFRLL